MSKLFAGLFAAALLIGLGTPTFTFAQDDPMEDAEESSMDSGDDSSMEEDSGSMDEAPEDPMEEAESE